jgi:hypothetical protein
MTRGRVGYHSVVSGFVVTLVPGVAAADPRRT